MLEADRLGGKINQKSKKSASAQGILAQMRILGGSLGIAASTAILHKEMMSGGGASLHVHVADRVRATYAEAFRTDMVVATVISAFAVLFTLVALQQRRRRRARRLREQDQTASSKS